jgi:hypothetical protein
VAPSASATDQLPHQISTPLRRPRTLNPEELRNLAHPEPVEPPLSAFRIGAVLGQAPMHDTAFEPIMTPKRSRMTAFNAAPDCPSMSLLTSSASSGALSFKR